MKRPGGKEEISYSDAPTSNPAITYVIYLKLTFKVSYRLPGVVLGVLPALPLDQIFNLHNKE